MQYAVDIVGRNVWVVGCFKCDPGSDYVDVQVRMGGKGLRYDYMYTYRTDGKLTPSLATLLMRKDMSKVWQIFGEDK